MCGDHTETMRQSYVVRGVASDLADVSKWERKNRLYRSYLCFQKCDSQMLYELPAHVTPTSQCVSPSSMGSRMQMSAGCKELPSELL